MFLICWILTICWRRRSSAPVEERHDVTDCARALSDCCSCREMSPEPNSWLECVAAGSANTCV